MATRIAGRIGRIDVFDPTQETWTSYKERLDSYFVANDIKDEKKVPALLSLVGARTYALLRDPKLPAENTYGDLTKILKEHYAPKPLVIVERFRFHKRDQQEGESVREYNAALRKLSEFCEFKDTLRDRFVCGLRNEQIQKKLLSEPDLKYKKAFDIALAMETASNDAVESQSKHLPSTGVNKINTQPTRQRDKNYSHQRPHPSPQSCFRCYGNHPADSCRFLLEKCRACGRPGHIQRACQTNPVIWPPKYDQKARKTKVHELDVEEEPMYSLKINAVGGFRDAIWVHP